jgi:hypothetical protein
VPIQDYFGQEFPLSMIPGDYGRILGFDHIKNIYIISGLDYTYTIEVLGIYNYVEVHDGKEFLIS